MAYMANQICPTHGMTIHDQVNGAMICRECAADKAADRKQKDDAEWTAMTVDQKLDWLRQFCIVNSHHQHLELMKF